MHLVYQVHGVHGVRLTGARCSTALVNPTDSTTFAEHHRAASHCLLILGVTHAETGNICNCVP